MVHRVCPNIEDNESMFNASERGKDLDDHGAQRIFACSACKCAKFKT